MKKVIYILLVGLMISVVSCKPKDSAEVAAKKAELQNEVNNRIKVKGYFSSPTTYYEIVEVDGQEYLTNSHGGIIRIEKKEENN